jgi:hypothetical protein
LTDLCTYIIEDVRFHIERFRLDPEKHILCSPSKNVFARRRIALAFSEVPKPIDIP